MKANNLFTYTAAVHSGTQIAKQKKGYTSHFDS